MGSLAVKRVAHSFVLGGIDDAFFLLHLGARPAYEVQRFVGDGVRQERWLWAICLPGHRYLIDVQPGEEVEWWKKGRKEDVLDIEGQPTRNASVPDGKPIVLIIDEPVEFKVLPLDD